ncbi:C6 transcription factor [Ilyonectria robusta]
MPVDDSNMTNENGASSSQEPSTANVTSTTTATTALTQPSNAGRKRRSCLMCSKRKVKCDKQKPCHNCAKAGSKCIFPTMAANRNQVGMAPELVDMLQRLEKVVQTLEPREQEKLENILPSHHYPDGDGNRDRLQTQPSGPSPTLQDGAAEAGLETSKQSSSAREENLNQYPELQKAKAPSTFSSREESPGMIVRDHGRETYVRRWFWDDGGTEVSSGSMTDEDCPDVQEAQDDVPNASREWFQGQTSNFEADLQHPAPKSKILDILITQRLQLWSIYKKRVEPLTKLLHLPSLEQAVMGLRPLSSADGMQCILLAVYYGAITSLTEEECVAIFESGQAQVLARLREELERMFSSAMLLHTGDIRPLQALVLYLVFLRHHEPRLSWNLSGLAVRLAQNFGLHREGSLFGLSKFKMEMRRRLWWQIAILDAPSAEDYSGEYNM